MRLRLTAAERTIIIAFLLGKSAGMNAVGGWSATRDHWDSLVYSAVILTTLFVLMNVYFDRKEARKAGRTA